MKETLPEPEPGVLAKAGTPESHQALEVEPRLMMLPTLPLLRGRRDPPTSNFPPARSQTNKEKNFIL